MFTISGVYMQISSSHKVQLRLLGKCWCRSCAAELTLNKTTTNQRFDLKMCSFSTTTSKVRCYADRCFWGQGFFFLPSFSFVLIFHQLLRGKKIAESCQHIKWFGYKSCSVSLKNNIHNDSLLQCIYCECCSALKLWICLFFWETIINILLIYLYYLLMMLHTWAWKLKSIKVYKDLGCNQVALWDIQDEWFWALKICSWLFFVKL